MITYDGICKKLGFDVLTYKVPEAKTENDKKESPFAKLTLDELCFLGEYMNKNNK